MLFSRGCTNPNWFLERRLRCISCPETAQQHFYFTALQGSLFTQNQISRLIFFLLIFLVQTHSPFSVAGAFKLCFFSQFQRAIKPEYTWLTDRLHPWCWCYFFHNSSWENFDGCNSMHPGFNVHRTRVEQGINLAIFSLNLSSFRNLILFRVQTSWFELKFQV